MVSRFLPIAAALLALAATPAQARIEPAPGCDFGPVTRTLAGTEWLFYGCKADGALVVVAAPGNPMPLVSMLAFPFEKGAYRVVPPKSDEPQAEAALEALEAMSGDELRAIVAETGVILPAPAKPR